MNVSLTMKSGNVKVGKIPVSTTEEDSCPKECALNGTDCYALFGPLKLHWSKVSAGKRGLDRWSLFCKAVSRFPAGQKWRHNQAGDLPKDGRRSKVDRIHRSKLRQLSAASAGKRGWTYTHYDPTDSHNQQAIADANSVDGLTINLSADSMKEADDYYKLGIAPVVCILPKDAPNRGNRTPAGIPIVVCPAQTTDTVSCEQCMLCEKRNRKTIVGFKAHGTASKRLSKRVAHANS